MHRIAQLILVITLATLLPTRDAMGSMEPVDKALIIDGIIGNGGLRAMGDHLMEFAASTDDVETVDIVIASPGGVVDEGFSFINKMEEAKAIGLHIRCYVAEMAASMAFQILVHCDERYALSRSFLMWHHARVFIGGGLQPVPLTASQLTNVGGELAALDRMILAEVTDAVVALSLGVAAIKEHFEAETLHLASDLERRSPKFITTYNSIPGLLELLNQYRAEKVKQGIVPQSFDSLFNRGQIIYIAPGVK